MRNTLLYILFFSTIALQVQGAPPLWEAEDNNFPIIISLVDFNRDNDIRVYPNPATDYIMVSENDKVDQVLIYNVLGKLVKKFEAESHKKYYINDLPKGMYVVRLLDSKNNLVTTV